MDLQQGFGINDIVALVKRRGWLVTCIVGVSLLLSIFVASILPDEYQASATLLIEPQTISENLVESGLANRDVNARLHLIQMQILSRGRLSRVIDTFNLYQDESKDMTREDVINMMRDKITLAPVLPELQEQIKSRRQDIEINTFVLSFRHTSPRVAADVTNRLANDFTDEHIKERVEISGDTSEFIQAELTRLAQRMDEVESRIAAVKSENAGQLPEDFDSTQRLLERALSGIRDAERDAALARSDESFFRQQAIASASLGSGDEQTNPARRLESLDLSLNELRARGLTDKHPDVISLKDEIAALRAQLEGQDEGAEEAPASIAQQSARAEAERAALRASAAEEEVRRLRQQASDLEARLAATPRVAETLAGLQRERDQLLSSYRDFSQKRLSANVAADMERRQKGEQFRILEAAYPDSDPVAPNRPVIVLLGLVVGLGAAGGAAFLLEASDTSFKSPRNLQDQLRIPVLASIPAVLLESDRVARRRRLLRRALAATAFTSVMLVASLVGNWTVNGLPGPIQSLIEGEEAAPAAAPPAAEQQG